MNKITKLFVLAVLSVMATPNAGFADYPASGSNPSGRPTQTYPTDQDQDDDDQTPSTSGERSFMRGATNRYDRLRQQNRNMYTQDRQMIREGYDPNEGYYSRSPGRSYPGQFRGQEQMMRGDYYNQGGYPASDAGSPQSYPINENYPNAPRYRNYPQQGNYGPRGPNSAYPRYSDAGSGSESGYEIKVNGNEKHPVYEYMLGKDGKWHTVSVQDHPGDNAHWQTSDHHYELGYNDPSDSNRNPGDKASPESYPLNENYPNAPRNDNRSLQKDDSDDQAYYQQSPYQGYDQYIGDRAGDKTSRTKKRQTAADRSSSWSTDEQNPSGSTSTGSSSSTKRNVQR